MVLMVKLWLGAGWQLVDCWLAHGPKRGDLNMRRLYFGLFLLVDAAAALFDPLRQSRPVDIPNGLGPAG